MEWGRGRVTRRGIHPLRQIYETELFRNTGIQRCKIVGSSRLPLQSKPSGLLSPREIGLCVCVCVFACDGAMGIVNEVV